jgi:secreted PhoX family phosphatase
MDRRAFLRRAVLTSAAAGLGPRFWASALAAPAQPGPSPYGELQAPDRNGLMLPPGFTSRVVASSFALVPGTKHVWHMFPDGGGCLPTDDGGWIYVSNSENPPPVDVPGASAMLARLARAVPGLPTTGGAGAIRFAADGSIVDAYEILRGSQSNCAGGLTPWGTWLSCEEWEDTQGYDAGRVWECDPFGVAPAVARPSLGIFKHEMATSDPDRQRLYLSEDQPDGLLYRYTPSAGTWGSGAALDGGLLEAMAVDAAGHVTWISVADFVDPAAPAAALRRSVPGATTFNGGEGVLYDAGLVYLTTKGDDRVWVHDVEAQTVAVLYDGSEHITPVLNGVDNIAVSAAHDLYVAEDGGDLEVCVITPERAVFPIVRMTGGRHGFANPTPIPLISEVTGLALSPDGNRLYFNSERGMGVGGLPIGPGPGILYEVTGPFRGGTLAA